MSGTMRLVLPGAVLCPLIVAVVAWWLCTHDVPVWQAVAVTLGVLLQLAISVYLVRRVLRRY